MKLLIIGGTRFLGRAIAAHALDRGHELTLFHRGQSNPELFPEATHILGDRDGDLGLLDGMSFDACIDTCGYFPRIVRASAEALADKVQQYAFVSSVSVYADPNPDRTDETAALATLDDPTIEEITGESYGPLKALCEAEVSKVFGERAILVRPGLIVGPHDTTDRFTYWPWRMAQGGAVLAPGRQDRGIQLIDVRDLGAWIVTLVESGASGAFNATSQPGDLTMTQMLDTCVRVAGTNAKAQWIPDEFLLQHEAGPWMELPLWIPESAPIAKGFFSFVSDRAIEQGLTLRPLEETIQATLDWVQTRTVDYEWKAGMARDREDEILKAWSEAADTLNS